MDLKIFVENVNYYCNLRGVSATAACLNAGLSRTFLTDVKNKQTNPRLSSLSSLADYFGVTVSELLSETGPHPLQASDLTEQEQELVSAYRAANDQARGMVDFALEPFKEKKNARNAAG